MLVCLLRAVRDALSSLLSNVSLGKMRFLFLAKWKIRSSKTLTIMKQLKILDKNAYVRNMILCRDDLVGK